MWNPFKTLRSKSKLAGDAAWMTFSNVGTQGFGLLHTIGMVTLLTITKFNLYILAIEAVSLAYQFLDVRVDESLIKLFTEYRTKGDYGRAKRMVQVAYAVNFIIAGIVFLIAFFVLPRIAYSWLTDATEETRLLFQSLIRIYAFAPLAGCVQPTSLGIIQALGKFRIYGWLIWLAAALRLAIPVTLALWGVKPAMVGFVVIIAACSSLVLPIALSLLRKNLPDTKAVPLGLDRKRVFIFNVHTMLSITVKGLTQRVPFLILGRFSAGGVTAFKLSCQLMGLLQSATGALGQVSFPRLAETWARNDRRAFGRLIGKVTLYAGAIAVPLAIAVALFAPMGIHIIDTLKEFKGSASDTPLVSEVMPLVYVMLPGSVVICLTLWLRPAALAMGKPVLSTCFNTLIAAIAVGGTWTLVRAYGAIGAAWAYSIMWTVGLGLFALTVLVLVARSCEKTEQE